jgi:putative DNA primase/helicase
VPRLPDLRDEGELIMEHVPNGYERPDEFSEELSAELEAALLSAEPVPPPSKPMQVAEHLLQHHQQGGLTTWLHWRGSWMQWRGSHWVEIEERTVRAWVYARLKDAVFKLLVIKKAKDEAGKSFDDEKWVLQPWDPNRRKVADVLEALRAIVHLPESAQPPCWLRTDDDGALYATAADPVVVCSNGLLDVRSRQLYALTPSLLNLVSTPYAYAPDAPAPVRWLNFLQQLWPDDPEAIAALRQWFGYVLSGDTSQQKILLMIGPLRSGKGTIARILTALIGSAHVANPTLGSLSGEFGLAPLIGKPLATVSDARLGEHVNVVIERLLSISGEDALTINRKYRDQWTGQLPTRFMLLSNELPRFGDASGAIASRFVILTMARSFLGKENTKLTAQLLEELPGILLWALDGLDELTEAGQFTVPQSSDDTARALQDLVSPISAFVRDLCDRGPDYSIRIDWLYRAYRDWCEDNGLPKVAAPTFGRDLRAAVPGLKVAQPRWDNQKRHYAGIQLKSQTVP